MKGVYSTESCVICMSDAPCIIFVPCRHLCTCSDCNERILNAKMNCPLCRATIGSRKLLDTEPVSSAGPLDEEQLAQYRKALGKVASNAGFVGKSKLARSVGGTICSEYELRVRESRGASVWCACLGCCVYEVPPSSC